MSLLQSHLMRTLNPTEAFSAYVKWVKTKEEQALEGAVLAALPIVGSIMSVRGYHPDYQNLEGEGIYDVCEFIKKKKYTGHNPDEYVSTLTDCIATTIRLEKRYSREQNVFDPIKWAEQLYSVFPTTYLVELKRFIEQLPKAVYGVAMLRNRLSGLQKEASSQAIFRIMHGQKTTYKTLLHYGLPEHEARFVLDYSIFLIRQLLAELGDPRIIEGWEDRHDLLAAYDQYRDTA